MAKTTKEITVDDLNGTIELLHGTLNLTAERTILELAAGNVRDPAKAAHSVALALGIAMTKRDELEERPPPGRTPTSEDLHREVNGLLRDLNIRIPGLLTDEPVESPACLEPGPGSHGQPQLPPPPSQDSGPTRSSPSASSQPSRSSGASYNAESTAEEIVAGVLDNTLSPQQPHRGWLQIPPRG